MQFKTVFQKKMKNKTIIQESLFDLIRKKAPTHISFADKVSEVLGINIDAVYRRIRGENLVSLDEAVTLCKYFSVSFDELLYGKDKMQYSFVPTDINDVKSYLAYAKEMAFIAEKIQPTPTSEIRLVAADIPAFYYAAYKELSLFQLFSWDKNVYDFSGTFEDFINEIDVESISQYGNIIFKNFQKTPSSEIWTDNTIDSTLKSLKYHFEMEHFNDSSVPLLICEQLLDLINELQEWIKNGTKGSFNTPFKFYTNEVDTGNTLILMKNEKQNRCVIRLFTINGLNINDMRFCQEVEHWIDSLIKRSVLISGISSKERFKFFTAQKQKILTLIDFIKTF